MTALESARSTPEAVTDPSSLVVEAPRGRPTGEWGMFLFVATEATLFACLLASYFYLRFAHGGAWPPGGIEKPKLLKPAIMTVTLLLSSVPMIWGDHAIRHGHPRRLQVAIPITIVLGLFFLLVQAGEYAEKLAKFTWTTNVYGSIFYTITGFHGFHVLTGLVMLAYTEIAALRGKFTQGRHERVRMVSIYWHFVDVVWIAIVLSLYVSPHLGG